MARRLCSALEEGKSSGGHTQQASNELDTVLAELNEALWPAQSA